MPVSRLRIAIGFFFLLFSVVLVFAVGNSLRAPSDDELIKLLEDRRAELDQCARDFLLIAPGRLSPRGGCGEGQGAEVRLCRQLQGLGIKLAVEAPEGDAVLFAVYMFGTPGSVRRGLAFSPKLLAGSGGGAPVGSRELTGGEGPKHGIAFRQINGPWYVFREE